MRKLLQDETENNYHKVSQVLQLWQNVIKQFQLHIYF